MRSRMLASSQTLVEQRFRSVFAGKPLDAWTQERVDCLLSNAGCFSPPLRLEENRSLLSERRIREIRFRRGLPERGRLEITPDGFVVDVALSRKSIAPLYRVTLAHEVAHTLFYNIAHWPPTDLARVEAGNPHLEWVCWYIARSLLAPATWLAGALEAMARPDGSAFSLRSLRLLEEQFEIPLKTLAQRLVVDLRWWPCASARLSLGSNGRWRQSWSVAIPKEPGGPHDPSIRGEFSSSFAKLVVGRLPEEGTCRLDMHAKELDPSDLSCIQYLTGAHATVERFSIEASATTESRQGSLFQKVPFPRRSLLLLMQQPGTPSSEQGLASSSRER